MAVRGSGSHDWSEAEPDFCLTCQTVSLVLLPSPLPPPALHRGGVHCPGE